MALLLAACAHPTGAIRVTAAMKVTDVRMALGPCSFVCGGRVPPVGRELRIEWRGGKLDGRLVCGEGPLPEDPHVQQIGILHWEPSENGFSASHPSGPGRVMVLASEPFDRGVDGYFDETSGERRSVEATPAIRFLSALARVAPKFDRLVLPGLKASP